MANTVFSNKIIEAKFNDLLATKINARSLMTIDDTLTESAGMTKTINTYTYTGSAEVVADGVATTASNHGSIAYAGKDYTVNRVKHAFDYTDTDAMKDSAIVDGLLANAVNVMKNKMTSDFYAALATTGSDSEELVKGITFAKTGALNYDVIVDAISELNVEDESGIFVVIPNAWKASLRKDADYKSAMQGQVIYNGQVGTVAGIPVICTKALTDKAYVMTTEAVKCFIKKGSEVEQDRDADKCVNTVHLRETYICALVDATKACKITKATA